MQTVLYDEFIQAKERGVRSLAASKLRQFIDSFVSESERELWVRQFLESGKYGHKIHHVLYEEVIFPVLLRGYKAQDPWSLYYLAGTSQNHCRAAELNKQVDWHSARSLLELCFERQPDYRDVRNELLRSVTGRLNFYIHEWPSGLCGEVSDVEMELALARRLDPSPSHLEFFEEVDAILEEARVRYGCPPSDHTHR
jgi:hypothetical protein